MEVVRQILNLPGVRLVKADMCMPGMTSHIDARNGARGPVKKPTGFITSSWCLAGGLNIQCDGKHDHVQLLGGRA